MDRNSKIAEARAELSLAQIRDRDHRSQGDLLDHTTAERHHGGQKWSDVSLLIGLFAGIHLGRCAGAQEDPEITQYGLRARKSKVGDQRKPRRHAP